MCRLHACPNHLQLVGLPSADDLRHEEIGVEKVHVLVQESMENQQPVGPEVTGKEQSCWISGGRYREESLLSAVNQHRGPMSGLIVPRNDTRLRHPIVIVG